MSKDKSYFAKWLAQRASGTQKTTVSELPKALRLADELDALDTPDREVTDSAAAELRRLSEVNQKLSEALLLARLNIATEIAALGPRTLNRKEKEKLIAQDPAIKVIDAALKKARGER